MSKNARNLTKGKKTHLYTKGQLAALVSPRTREVFETLLKDGPMSVGQLQNSLDFQSKTLYYQVRKLVNAGLVVSTQPEDGAELFRTVAQAFSIPPGYQGAAYERLAAKGVVSIMRKQARLFVAAAEASQKNPELVDRLYLRTASLKLSKTCFDKLNAEISNLVLSYADKPDLGAPPVEFVMVVAPRDS